MEIYKNCEKVLSTWLCRARLHLLCIMRETKEGTISMNKIVFHITMMF